MAILGAHMSIAGGYYKAVEEAHRCGCECVQIFTKNNNQWRAKPITETDIHEFRSKLKELNIGHPISHSSYLINLASPKPELWKKSVAAFIVELERAEALGIPYVVLHPGAFVDSSEAQGIRRVIRALDQVHRSLKGIAAQCLLETTAGQGTNLGWQFDQLARMLDGVREPERLGVCLDTCHVFAAGYSMDTEKAYKKTMRELNQTIGVKRVRAFHLNDSRRELGSRVDRHEHIGRGHMGLEPFRWLLADRRFRKIPMYLETPKGTEKGQPLDTINLNTLRKLIP
ncbi:MAG: deoxyribonuclease IV [Pirellulaceae bacterium]|nr:deoxyribonuclease IV [Pirellulaceae bacterium]